MNSQCRGAGFTRLPGTFLSESPRSCFGPVSSSKTLMRGTGDHNEAVGVGAADDIMGAVRRDHTLIYFVLSVFQLTIDCPPTRALKI